MIIAIFAIAAAASLSLALSAPAEGDAVSSALYAFAAFGIFALAGAVVMTLRFSRLSRSSATGFNDLLRGTAAPAAMTDAAGRLVTANPAFWAKGGAEVGALVGTALAGWCSDGDAVAYRLAHGALSKGGAGERVHLKCGGEAYIHVMGVAEQRLLWMIAAGSDRSAPLMAADTLARFTVSPKGRVTRANAAFLALCDDDRDLASREGAAACAEGRGSAEIRLSHGRHATIASLGGDRALDMVLVPAPMSHAVPPGPVFEELPVALARLSSDGRLIVANEAARALLGDGAVQGARFSDIVEGLGCPIDERIAAAAAGKPLAQSDLARGTRRDREVYVRVVFRNISGGGDGGLFAVLNDATDLRTLEQQFVQSQKMQAVGQLAGGVAHDFNNLLTAILGHCDLLTIRRDEADPDFEDLSQIRQNANRAAALVRQLLAFSRQQKLTPKSCTLVDTLAELTHLLDRLIGERIALSVECAPDVWPVWIDEPQFEQVIVNLVVNARDAMPEGGDIRIRCQNMVREEPLFRDRAVVPPGEYVEITIEDEGAGMSEEVAAKIFEPFFTTKAAGKGTGLGLSTAYGIIKQTGGFIFVDSAPGEGAVFRIFFRRHTNGGNAPEISGANAKGQVDLSGSGRILLVEDEAPVRAFACRALKLRGYEVEEAASGEQALALIEGREGAFDLIISDVVMPGMDGPSWVKKARLICPAIPVIFTSGYAEDVFRNGLREIENCDFLPKPFTLDDLATAAKRRLLVKALNDGALVPAVRAIQ